MVMFLRCIESLSGAGLPDGKSGKVITRLPKVNT